MPISNECEGCGGELVYDPTSGELKCNRCSQIEDIPEQNTKLEKKELLPTSDIKTSKTKYAQYNCNTCGRNHISSTSSELITCPSCGDSNLVRTLNVEYVPDGIIPFKLNKESAINCFKQWLKKRMFAPSKLKDKVTNFVFCGVYNPVYLYDFDCETKYSGIGTKRVTRYKYNSTTKRTETITQYRSEHFSGNRSDSFRNYLDSANTTLPTRTISKIANYNYQDICVYRPEFLYGWVGSVVNISLKDSVFNTKLRIKSDIEDRIRISHAYDSIQSLNSTTNYSLSKFGYLYLPIWVCSYKYKQATYNFFINGSTGKTDGKAPKSKGKITALTLFILSVIGVLGFLIIKYLL